MDHVRMRVLLLGVIVAVTALALTASSALAVPEFGQCFKHPTHEGKYTNSVCTSKAKKVNEKFTGEFEWRKATEIEAAKRKYKGSGGPVVLTAVYKLCEPGFVRVQTCHTGETENALEPIGFTCESEVDEGLIGLKTVTNVKVTFKGCENTKGFGGLCQNTATAGEIQLNALKGTLGFINKKVTPREAGLQLESSVKKGKIASFTCPGPELSFVIGMGNETEGCVYPQKLCGGDGVIAAITPVDTATTTFTQILAANEATVENSPTKFEGTKPLKELESYFAEPTGPASSKWSKMAESLTSSDTTPEALEIKSK